MVTSKTVRRLWLPVFEVRYALDDDEFACFVNAQSGRAFGERPAVNRPALLGAVGLSAASLSVVGLVAYRLAAGMRGWASN